MLDILLFYLMIFWKVSDFMKQKLKYIGFIFVAICIIIVSILLFKKSVNNYTQDVVNYTENSSIDYKVFLNKNSYFDEPYLGKDKAYISSLIDYIDIDFAYDLKLNSKRSGKYLYYIKGVMSANANNSENNFWKKTYDLKKSEFIDYDDTNHISFSSNVKINYQEYNDLLLKFKEDFKLSMDGSFKVVLYVENYIDGVDDKSLSKQTITSLEIPLTKSTIEVPIKTDEISDSNIIAGDIVYNNSIFNYILRIFSVIIFVAGLILISYNILKIVRGFEKISAYNKELRKILKTYDGIIVNVKQLNNLKGYNVIEVNNFSELLDAHGEIRQPINFYENNKQAVFTLINNKVVWKYVLKDNCYE